MYLDTEKRLTKLEALVKFRNEIFSINTSSVVPPAFTSFIKKHDRIISIRENVLATKTNFTSPLFMKVAAPRQDSERSCICVLGVCHFSIGLWNFFDNVIRCFCLQLSVEYFAVSNVVFCCFVFVCFVLLRLVQLKLTIYNILICLVKLLIYLLLGTFELIGFPTSLTMNVWWHYITRGESCAINLASTVLSLMKNQLKKWNALWSK